MAARLLRTINARHRRCLIAARLNKPVKLPANCGRRYAELNRKASRKSPPRRQSPGVPVLRGFELRQCWARRMRRSRLWSKPLLLAITSMSTISAPNPHVTDLLRRIGLPQ